MKQDCCMDFVMANCSDLSGASTEDQGLFGRGEPNSWHWPCEETKFRCWFGQTSLVSTFRLRGGCFLIGGWLGNLPRWWPWLERQHSIWTDLGRQIRWGLDKKPHAKWGCQVLPEHGYSEAKLRGTRHLSQDQTQSFKCITAVPPNNAGIDVWGNFVLKTHPTVRYHFYKITGHPTVTGALPPSCQQCGDRLDASSQGTETSALTLDLPMVRPAKFKVDLGDSGGGGLKKRCQW